MKVNAKNIQAQISLNQLWEETCAEADNIGPDGVRELEKQLILFRQYCNEQNSLQVSTATERSVKNIPMTHGIYKGNVERVFNTHNM